MRRQKKKADVQTKARLKAGLRAMENDADPVKEREREAYVLPRKLKVGDEVLIVDLDKSATVLEEEDTSGNVLVQAGIIKTRVPVENLRLLEKKQAKKQVGSTTRTVRSRAEAPVMRELDLRGETASEALLDLDNFIDGALLSGIHMLTVIHGKGTGVLRKAVQEHLRRHPSVKSYRLGTFGEGENGVTIVELK